MFSFVARVRPQSHESFRSCRYNGSAQTRVHAQVGELFAQLTLRLGRIEADLVQSRANPRETQALVVHRMFGEELPEFPDQRTVQSDVLVHPTAKETAFFLDALCQSDPLAYTTSSNRTGNRKMLTQRV